MPNSNSNEIWKAIPNYDGLYKISNFGQVKSLKGRNERILKQTVNRGGYSSVTLSKPSEKVKTIAVHKLVACAFIGEQIDGMGINHIDGNKVNNHVSNLEYCTSKENTQHAIEMGLINQYGENNSQSKLAREQVLEIRATYKRGGITQRELGEQYGITQTTVGSIVRRKIWKHI